MTLAQALLYAAAPAAVGVIAALALVFLARSQLPRDAPPDAQARMMVYAAIPFTALVLAVVGVMSAQDADPGAVRVPLLALGLAGLVQAGAQGLLASRAARTLAASPEAFGRTLLPMAAAEVPTIAALMWVLMTTSVTTTP